MRLGEGWSVRLWRCLFLCVLGCVCVLCNFFFQVEEASLLFEIRIKKTPAGGFFFSSPSWVFFSPGPGHSARRCSSPKFGRRCGPGFLPGRARDEILMVSPGNGVPEERSSGVLYLPVIAGSSVNTSSSVGFEGKGCGVLLYVSSVEEDQVGTQEGVMDVLEGWACKGFA